MRDLWKILKWILLAVLMFVAGEALFFAMFRPTPAPAETIDLLVSLKGSKERIKIAYRLLQKQTINHFLIPGASKKTLQQWSRKYKLPAQARHLVSDSKTASTFEDVLLAAGVIQQNGFGSMMLVTSDYHLPRSWMLMRAVTFGNNVKIYSVGVKSGKNPSGIWLRVKLTYNEMVKFWGSIFEMAYYKTTGHLLYANTRVAHVVLWLKKIFLFDLESGRSEK